MANCSNLSSVDLKVIGITGAITSSISLIGCMLVILIMIVYKKYVFTTQRLILYLTLSVSLDSILHIIQGWSYHILPTSTDYCMAIGFLKQYLAWCIILSIISILIELSLRVVCKRGSGTVECLYVPFIYLVPLVISWIPFIKHSYGDNDGSCSILIIIPGSCKRDQLAFILDITLWWVPLYITFLLVVIVYLAILCHLNVSKKQYTPLVELDREAIYQRTMNDIGYLKWYPLLYMFINIIPIITATISYARPYEDEFALNILSTIIAGLQGGFIALAVTLDPSTRKRLGCKSFCAAVKENVLCRDTAEEYPILEGSFTDSLNMSQK